MLSELEIMICILAWPPGFGSTVIQALAWAIWNPTNLDKSEKTISNSDLFLKIKNIPVYLTVMTLASGFIHLYEWLPAPLLLLVVASCFKPSFKTCLCLSSVAAQTVSPGATFHCQSSVQSNCHSQGLTLCKLLPLLQPGSAVSAIPCWKVVSFGFISGLAL